MKYLFTLLLCGLSCFSFAQVEFGAKDTVASSDVAPQQAAMYSAIIPGLGQIANKKAWKVPIVYAVGAGIGYSIYYNHKEMKLRRDALVCKINGYPGVTCDFSTASEVALHNASENFRRTRDLSIIIGIVAYGLNVVDAAVDAHLKTKDFSDDLGWRVQPKFENVGLSNTTSVGLTLVIPIK